MTTSTAIKSGLRTNILEKRNILDQELVRRDSATVVGRLREAGFLATSKTILLYLPVKNEVDTRELFPELLRRGTEVLLPRCRDGESGELDLHCVTGLSQVRSGRFGILEPDPDICPLSGNRIPEAALVPGVAFDRRGYRLGFGGGYYDRLFARPEMTGTIRVGLAFDFQIIERLPAEPWDKPMHALCTPREFVWIRP